MKYSILVNEKSISSNTAYGRNGNRSYLTKPAHELQEAIIDAFYDKYKKIIAIEGPVVLKVRVEKRKKWNSWDLDNTLKIIQDSVVKAGIIIDDGDVVKIVAVKGDSKRDTITIVVEKYPFGELYNWEEQ